MQYSCSLVSSVLINFLVLHTHALRIRWSRSAKYASYRKSPGSSTDFLLLFMPHFCSLPEGTGGMCLYRSGEAGIKKGRAPLGEA